MFNGRFRIRTLTLLLGLLFGIMIAAHTAYADNNLNRSAKFMQRYCLHVNGKLKGLNELVTKVNALIDVIENIKAALSKVGVEVKVPQMCTPDVMFGVDLSIPGLESIGRCFAGLNFSIQLPNFNDMAACLLAEIPKIDVVLPSIDTDAMLACLANLDNTLDIKGLAAQLAAIMSALVGILDSLQHLKLTLTAKLDANLFVALKALGRMCSQAGMRPAKAGAPFR